MALVTASAEEESEQGSILPLLVGMLALLALLAGGVVDLSYLYLSQRALYQVADSAALSAVTQIDNQTYYTDGASGHVPTTNHATIVARVIRSSQFPNSSVESLAIEEGALVLTLAHRVTLPWPFLIDSVVIRARAAAQPEVAVNS